MTTAKTIFLRSIIDKKALSEAGINHASNIARELARKNQRLISSIYSNYSTLNYGEIK